MALIFGVIALFVVILFVLQRSDLNRVADGDAKAVQRAVAEGGSAIENPTTMEEQQLWAALAVKPIDEAAIKARASIWGSARRSQHLAWVVMGLIFLTVPADLPHRKLPAAVDRRAADRDRGDLRQRAGAGAGRRRRQRLREGRCGDGAARLRGDRAPQGQHRDAGSDDREGRPEDPRRSAAQWRAPRTASQGTARRRRGKPAERGHGAARHTRVQGEIARWAGARCGWRTGLDRDRPRRGPQLGPLEEADGGRRPGGDRRQPARAARRPTGSATSGSPSASPTPSEPARSAAVLDSFDCGVGGGSDCGIGQLDPGRQLDVQLARGIDPHPQ